MAVKTAKAESRVDMLNGPLLGKIIVYTLPIIFSGFLQLAYNAADIIVVGKFAENSTHALAAVGSTTALMNLFVNICMDFPPAQMLSLHVSTGPEIKTR